MIQLHDAITSTFPQGNEWAAEALELLSGELEPSTLVHGVIEGWLQRGGGDDVRLVDTLFVLTDTRLGLGRIDEAPGERRWIHLADVVAVDAIDDSALPLQTIELELADGFQVCLGWPESFTDVVVEVLIAVAERGVEPDAPDALPRELVDPSIVASDPAVLDGLGPSGWVEREVPAPPVAGASAAPGTKVVAALGFFNEPEPEPVSLLGRSAPAAPEPPAAVAPAPAPEDAPPVVPADLWLNLDRRRDTEPLARDAFDTPPSAPDASEPAAPPTAPLALDHDPFGAAAVAPSGDPVALPAPSMTAAAAPIAPVAPVAREVPGATAPWLVPGRTWPDPLRGVLYLGGHPGHPRKRKNGSMVFSPAGLSVSGSGFQSWDMNIDWAYVEAIDIMGPDEVLFADDLKIDSTSSALIVRMEDETRMFFEIRTRRPPSLRAGLAPILLMISDIRTYRAGA